ncbi:MAG TPA: glucose-1-phosphate thymidylyltransferase, partial [Methanotrichaceae archaeon]|nr:glucose-1-phosphate thymidylyltransferase [Methanotrichaceae archaeon]
LSGGSGTRLRPLTYSQQKQLIPVANMPVLFYAIEDIIEAGISDIGIILGPNKEQVIETVKSADWNADIEFIYQGDPKGLAHTILVAEEFLDDDFVMYLGDNILRDGIAEHKKMFCTQNNDARVLLTKVEDPQRFGVADLNEDGSIRRLVEKPKVPPSNYALVGVYFFKSIIIEACKEIKPSWRNELEITDAIQWLIENGYRVDASFVEGWWKDTGKPEDIFEANRLILDDIKSRSLGQAENSRIMGRVVLEEGTEIRDSIIKGPCIIGRGSAISGSYIGPYTAIGSDCRISGTEVEDSIIMDGSNILNAGRIVESLIGRNVRIHECDSKPKGYRLIVGDNSDLSL